MNGPNETRAQCPGRLGPYVLEKVLGRGGMGTVYRAFDEVHRRAVAIKTTDREALGVEGAGLPFRREAAWLLRCDNPHVAAVYAVGTADGVDYIAMELMAGTLDVRMAEGPVGRSELVVIGAQILMALAAAHHAGVVHRDVKPANIGLTSTGMVKLLDFGVADALPCCDSNGDWPTGPAMAPMVAGSLPYMAPEQLRGETVDARADLYGTGVVLYELATGRLPFRARTAAGLIDAVLHRRAPRPSTFNSALGDHLDGVILRALAKNPRVRFPSAEAMMDALLRRSRALTWNGAATQRAAPFERPRP